MIKVVMVEDDDADGRALYDCLGRYAKLRGEKFQVAWFKTALDFVTERPPADIIFMDIELPGINGMEAAEILRGYDSETLLIFVTNLAKYAVGGYTVGAIDFIVKPVGYDDFALRMDRALRVLKRKKGRSVFVPTKDGLVVMDAGRVEAIEVKTHNLIYHMADGTEDFSHRGTLSQVEADLADSSFVRISNSCLVNMEHVRRIQGVELHMQTGHVYYISRAKRAAALEAIAAYYGGNA